MTNQQYIKQMPKIDLHCHLDGSLPTSTICRLAEKARISLPEDTAEFIKQITVPDSCTSLAEYLSCFHLPISCLQSAENLFDASRDLLAAVSKENVIYIEVRFAPMLSVHEDLPLDTVIDSVLQGLEVGKEKFGVGYGVILCALRHQPHEINSKLLAAVDKFGDRGVVALDLAGNEKRFPVQKHQALFEKAARMEIPFTIHAGEADGPASVWTALSLGAKRIGHGIAMKDDPDLMAFCRDNNIGIELCPISNLQTKAAADWEDYPFQLFLKEGLPITVNTDNRTVSNTALTREFSELEKVYGLTTADLETLFRNSANLSFAPNQQKQKMHAAFDEFKKKTCIKNRTPHE